MQAGRKRLTYLSWFLRKISTYDASDHERPGKPCLHLPKQSLRSMSTQQSDKKPAGVWMDHSHAIVVDSENGEFGITQKIEMKSSHHAHSGGSEHTHHQAGQATVVKFYHELADKIHKYDEILLFGPGTAQEEMFNYLIHNKQFAGKKVHIDSADHMTDNQMVAKVRTFYAAHPVGK
jgi:hypothetical protein